MKHPETELLPPVQCDFPCGFNPSYGKYDAAKTVSLGMKIKPVKNKVELPIGKSHPVTISILLECKQRRCRRVIFEKKKRPLSEYGVDETGAIWICKILLMGSKISCVLENNGRKIVDLFERDENDDFHNWIFLLQQEVEETMFQAEQLGVEMAVPAYTTFPATRQVASEKSTIWSSIPVFATEAKDEEFTMNITDFFSITIIMQFDRNHPRSIIPVLEVHLVQKEKQMSVEEFKKDWEEDSIYTYDIPYDGLLFSDHHRKRGRIAIDGPRLVGIQ
ncbi:hypothetical protein BGW36DRAFT_365697 [Talaromyces proteolyticus]|uniref:Uncharacterized protein n=1 Tax=Talaromyces proteolyticus TaxID=1131652 RepID=A0AAD4KDR5_9EURO|nr:uncharacterized protein BGW36DRAFT_365697 [Talaromyces proteolyticus]KAH8689166.1 hypothetical protein BGW36DRAFT_365697 [Talaromyces proteolyticus]